MIWDFRNSLVRWVRWQAGQAAGRYKTRLVEKMGLARRDGERQRPNRCRIQELVRKIVLVRHNLTSSKVLR